MRPLLSRLSSQKRRRKIAQRESRVTGQQEKLAQEKPRSNYLQGCNSSSRHVDVSRARMVKLIVRGKLQARHAPSRALRSLTRNNPLRTTHGPGKEWYSHFNPIENSPESPYVSGRASLQVLGDPRKHNSVLCSYLRQEFDRTKTISEPAKFQITSLL